MQPQGHFSYPAAAQGGMIAHNGGMMPVYPYYHYQYHGSQGLGVPAAHFFPPVSAAAIPTVPAIISKPPVMVPPKGTVSLFTKISSIRLPLCKSKNH
jgi:hypothetical protein